MVDYYLNTFSDETYGDINKNDFLIVNNEMYQHLGDLHNSVNQYFPNNQCKRLKNHYTWHNHYNGRRPILRAR